MVVVVQHARAALGGRDGDRVVGGADAPIAAQLA
jgi:hypothetical protein